MQHSNPSMKQPTSMSTSTTTLNQKKIDNIKESDINPKILGGETKQLQPPLTNAIQKQSPSKSNQPPLQTPASTLSNNPYSYMQQPSADVSIQPPSSSSLSPCNTNNGVDSMVLRKRVNFKLSNSPQKQNSKDLVAFGSPKGGNPNVAIKTSDSIPLTPLMSAPSQTHHQNAFPSISASNELVHATTSLRRMKIPSPPQAYNPSNRMMSRGSHRKDMCPLMITRETKIKNVVYNGTYPIDDPISSRFNEDVEENEDYEENEDEDEEDYEDFDEYEEGEYAENNDDVEKHPSYTIKELIQNKGISLNYQKMKYDFEKSFQQFDQILDRRAGYDRKGDVLAGKTITKSFDIDEPL